MRRAVFHKEKNMDNKNWEEKILSGIERLKNGNELVSRLDPEVKDFDGEALSCSVVIRPEKWMRNEFGKISGAASAALMEIATGIVAQAVMDDNVTLDMNVSYLRELSADNDVMTRVITVKPGRQILRLRGEMYDGNTGKLAVSAELSIMKV